MEFNTAPNSAFLQDCILTLMKAEMDDCNFVFVQAFNG